MKVRQHRRYHPPNPLQHLPRSIRHFRLFPILSLAVGVLEFLLAFGHAFISIAVVQWITSALVLLLLLAGAWINARCRDTGDV